MRERTIRTVGSRRALLCAGAVVACAAMTPLLPLIAPWAPPRVVEALRRGAYPGRVRALDLDAVRRPSTFSG